nr:hypothetical protein [uncultured Kingella sp.]
MRNAIKQPENNFALAQTIFVAQWIDFQPSPSPIRQPENYPYAIIR